MTTTMTIASTTKLDLDVDANEPSTGSTKSEVMNASDSMVFATAELELFVKSDAEEQTMYVDLRTVNYARVGDSDAERMLSLATLMNHRFSRQQAEMLVAVLSHELAKL